MATVWEHYGDVLQSDCTVVLHQANCFATMGAGIALQIKQQYPEAYQADLHHPIPVGSIDRLGKYSYGWDEKNDRVVFNLYGQHAYGRTRTHTSVPHLEESIHGVLELLNRNRETFPIKIGLPMFIGCGLAGGDWREVLPMLERCAEQHDFDLHLYRLK